MESYSICVLCCTITLLIFVAFLVQLLMASKIDFTTSTPLLNGSNYFRWSNKMKFTLIVLKIWFTVSVTKHPDKGVAEQTAWDETDAQAQEIIMLCVSQDIQAQIPKGANAEEIWDELAKLYRKPLVTTIFQDFKAMLNTFFPANSYPAPTLNKIQMFIN